MEGREGGPEGHHSVSSLSDSRPAQATHLPRTHFSPEAPAPGGLPRVQLSISCLPLPPGRPSSLLSTTAFPVHASVPGLPDANVAVEIEQSAHSAELVQNLQGSSPSRMGPRLGQNSALAGHRKLLVPEAGPRFKPLETKPGF